MGEPSKKDLRDLFDRAFLNRSLRGDPEATFISDCSDAGYRALYNAGKADAEARIAELERELAALQADNERMTRFVASLDNDAAAEKCVAVERYLAQSVLRYREERDELEALLAPLLADLSALRPLSEAGTQGEWETNAAPGWISVNVRLPDHPGREVLATDGPHCTVATYSSKRWWSAELGEGIEVTHWMPLPGPPPEADDARRDAAAEKARKP